MKSPCIGACFIPPHKTHCVRCGRERAEILNWSGKTEEQQQTIINAAKGRLIQDERETRHIK